MAKNKITNDPMLTPHKPSVQTEYAYRPSVDGDKEENHPSVEAKRDSDGILIPPVDVEYARRPEDGKGDDREEVASNIKRRIASTVHDREDVEDSPRRADIEKEVEDSLGLTDGE